MIRFRFEPSFRDWYALNRIVVLRQFRFLVIIAVAVLVAFLVYPAALAATGRDEGTVLQVYQKNLGVLWLPGIVCFLLGATYVGVRKRWKAAEEIRESREYEIDESGVRVTGSSLVGFLEWRHFKKAECKSGYFILKTAQNQFHYFPTSVVPDKSALSELLARKVGKD